MDFKLPLDQLIEKINQLIEKTKDLIQFYHDFCDYQQLPLKLKRELKEWPSKYRRNRQKFKEFTVEWNNFIGFDDTPAPPYTILDEEIVSILQHRLEKLKFYEGILKAKKKLTSKMKLSQTCNLQAEISSPCLDTDASQTCLQESETMTVCLKAIARLTVTMKGKVSWETTPACLDSSKTRMSDNSKGYISKQNLEISLSQTKIEIKKTSHMRSF